MAERVSVIHNKSPVLLVAPHGCDDINTAIIAETAAQSLHCSAVINRGFERHDFVDVNKNLADCNKVDHCQQDVVYDEFLKPIIRFRDKAINKSMFGTLDALHVFYIHGCGDIVHKEANEPVDVVIGYGLGIKKNSITADIWRKNLFVDCYRKFSISGDIFEGKRGGRYAARDKNNMAQYFRLHDEDDLVQAFQLEFPYSSRKTDESAELTGMLLATVIHEYLKHDDWTLVPNPKLI